MDTVISVKDIKELAQLSMELWAKTRSSGMPVISIYMPTHIKGKEMTEGQDSRRLRNLLNSVSSEMKQAGYQLTEEQLNNMLKPAYDLLADRDFWANRTEGLAIFITEDFFRCYSAPIEFHEKMIVDEVCHVLPLMAITPTNVSYYIVAVSQQHIRLFEANQYNIHEVRVPGINQTVEVNTDYGSNQNQVKANEVAIEEMTVDYHKHGGLPGNDITVEIRHFFLNIREALYEKLHEKNLPLLFAGVDYLFPIFKEAVKYPQLIKDKHISGNQDLAKMEEIHEKSMPFMREYFLERENKARTMIEEVAGTGRTSDDPEEIVKAVIEGRVQCLFANEDKLLWGQVDEQNFEMHLANKHTPQTVDFVNYAAIQTLLKGGNVFVTHDDANGNGGSLPASREQAAMIALFRY